MTEQDQQLLERLADAGKATTLLADDFAIAKLLEADGIVFIIRDTAGAIITPKGRNLLAANGAGLRARRKPIGSSRLALGTSTFAPSSEPDCYAKG